jgi:dihydropteroate synthase
MNSKKTLIMGILNITPDSFSDGGDYMSPDRALLRAHEMIAEGADLIDIGGESSRPGAKDVSEQEESKRVLPIIRLIRQHSSIPLSIDTRKARVAWQALENGANIVNDISGGLHDPEMAAVIAKSQAKIIIMHMRGSPQTMQGLTDYDNLIEEIETHLLERCRYFEAAGVNPRDIIIDPGLGFAKTAEQNWTILRHVGSFQRFGYQTLIGASRKSFIKSELGDKPENIRDGSLAIAAHAMRLKVDLIRVHDLAQTVRIRQVMGKL